MKILGVILLSVAIVTVKARHRKEWQKVDTSKIPREIQQTFYKSDIPACTKGAGFYRDPQDCHQFVRCVDEFGNGRHFSVFVGRCEPGLVFDENVSACNWPELAAPCSNAPPRFQEVRKPYHPEQVAQDNVVYQEQTWDKPYPVQQQQQVIQDQPDAYEQQQVPIVQEIQIAAQEPINQDKYPQVADESPISEQPFEEQKQVPQENIREPVIQEQVFQDNFQETGVQEQVHQDNIQVPVSQEQNFEEIVSGQAPAQNVQQIQSDQQQIIYQEPTYENNQNSDSRTGQASSWGFQQVVDHQYQQFDVPVQQGEYSQQENQAQWWVPEDRPQHSPPETADQIPPPNVPQGAIFCSQEGFYRHPENCSQFVRCVKIERGAYAVHFFECPKQLVFDEKDSACVVSDINICRSNTRKKRQASNTNLRCPDEGFFRHPEDCRAFYRCVKTPTGSYETHLFSCPANLVFDEEYTTCNWPEKAPPCDNKVQAYKPTRRPTQTQKPPYKQPSRTTSRGWSTKKPENDYIDKTITQDTYDSYAKRRNTGRPKVTAQPPETGPRCRSPGFFGSYSDCTKFFKCVRKGSNFVRYELACPNNFAFDDYSKRCVAQRYVASCSNRNRPYPPRQDDEETTTTTTTESTSSQSSNSESGNENIECEREGYFRHPEDCNRFYRCVDFNGNGEEFVRYDFKCPEGLVFDEVNSVCNWPDQSAPCDGSGKGDSGTGGEGGESDNGGNQEEGSDSENGTGENGDDDGRDSENENTTTQPSTEPTESTSSSSGDNNEEGGSDNESGDSGSEGECTKEGFYRNPEDCNKFYRCVDFNGEGKEFVKYDFTCPEGLVFDEVNSVCNWPEDSAPCDNRSDGGNGQDGTDGTTSNGDEGDGESSENGQSTPDGNESSSEAPSESTSDSGSRTSEGTTESSSEAPSESTSDSGSRTSESTTESSSDSTNDRSTSSPSEGDRNDESAGSNQGECTQEGYYRNPEDCTKFYRCVDFQGDGQQFTRYDFECPEGLVFDEVNSVCNWPDQSAPCENGGGSGRETTPSDGESSSEPSQGSTDNSGESSSESPTDQSTSGDSSDCSEPGFYRCKDDCSKFYRCVEEDGEMVRYDFKCPDGLIFDDQNKKCDWPSSELNCDESTTSSEQGSTTSSEQGSTTSSEQDSTTSSEQGSTTSSYESSTTEATQSSTSSSGTSSSGSSNKECTEEGFFRDPDDCSKYYRCTDEGDGTFTREDFSCAEDEVFDEEMRYCNRKDLAPPCDESETTTDKSRDDSECTESGFFRCRDDCNKFYRCLEENGTLTRYDFECPEGLIFDDRNDKCDYPSEELTCDTGSSTSSSPSTTESSSTSDSQTSGTTAQETSTTSTSGTTSSSNECTEEGYFRHPDDCSRYYRCIDEGDGTLTREDYACEEDEVFDEEMRYCNRKDLAPPCDETSSTTDSGSGGSTSSESESTTSGSSGEESTSSESETTTSGSSGEESTDSSSSTTSGSSGSGSGECEEEGFHRDPNDCGKFYRCVDFRGDGQSFTRYDFDCPEGLVFDETNDVCNWPSSVPSCESGGGSRGSTDSGSSTDSSSSDSSDSSTSSTESNEQTSTTSRPSDETSSTSRGDEGTTGNEESTTSSSTSSEGGTTSGGSTSDGGSTSRDSGSSSDNIECTEEGFFRHPEDCNKFYRCVDFRGDGQSFTRYDFDCPEGLVFDEVNSVCNWPNQSPSCESGSRGEGGDNGSEGDGSSGTTTQSSSDTDSGTTSQGTTSSGDGTTSSSSGSDDFECREEGFFKHETDCKKYYECKRDEDTGELVKIDCECPDGQVWDNESWYCNAEDLSPPCNSSSSSSFRCSEEGFFRDPEDCTKYYQCNRTGPGENDFRSEHHQCADGLVFDEGGRYCNAPELSEPCDDSSGSTSDGSSGGTTSDGSSGGTTSDGSSGGTTSDGTSSDQGECTREGFFRNPEDCTKYYECSRNENTGDFDRTDHTCPDGRIFDEGSNYCNDPELSEQPCDSNNESTTSNESSTSSTSGGGDDGGSSSNSSPGTRGSGGSGECTEEGFFRNPDDCNKFYRCVDFKGSGESYVRYDFDCPEGLHFDEVNSVCNWPTMTPPCESNNSSPAAE